MKLFLTKYLRLTHALYLCVGVTITPLFAQWCDGNLKQKSFLLCMAFTFVYAAFFSTLIHFIIKNLFWKLLVTVLAYVFYSGVLFIIFEFSPFILALPGIITLSVTMQLFDNIKDTFPRITKEEIRRWLEVILTLFTIFISSIMVGFVISWMNLYGAVLKGEIERKIVLSGINCNLIITIYLWFGASLIFLSGVKHLWDAEYKNRKNQI